jgi:hypothetical protein
MAVPMAFPGISRREICHIDWSPGRGSGQAGIRPALVVHKLSLSLDMQTNVRYTPN